MSAEADDGTLRSGFQLDTSYRGHRNPIRQCTYNTAARCFISLDERSLKLWRQNGDEVASLSFPPNQLCFITTCIHIPEYNLYFAAALDRTLKVYDERMNLVNSLSWGKEAGTVAILAFNPARDELITAGAGGVKVWACVPDVSEGTQSYYHMGGKSSLHNSVTWRQRKKTMLFKRLELDLPFVKALGPDGGMGDESWVPALYLNVESQLLFVFYSANLYTYDVSDKKGLLSERVRHNREGKGEQYTDYTAWSRIQPLNTWTMLHSQPITCVAYLPSRHYIITGARDSMVKVWRQKPQTGTMQMMRTIGSHTKSIVTVALHPNGNSTLTCSLDGSVQMWSLDTFEPMHRMKLAQAVLGLTIVDERFFYLFTEMEVKTFRLVHLHDTFAQYNSPVVHLESINNSYVLCVCEDSSARLVDTKNGESASTTVPQLSTKSLLQIKYSAALNRIYALLAHGEVHVYMCKTNPSIRKEVWEHTRKERLLAMCLCNGAVLGPLDTLGLERAREDAEAASPEARPEDERRKKSEYMICGTHDGDVIFLDVERGGQVIKRFPGHKNTQIKRVEVAKEQGLLLTLASSTVKLWRLVGTTVLHTLNFAEAVTCLGLLDGKLITGHAHGTVRMTDMLSGQAVPIPQAGDHAAAVSDINVSHKLQKFVTCSHDGTIKVFDKEKRLEAALALEAPVSCVCYLNTPGDILAGLGDKLIVIRAAVHSSIRKPGQGPPPMQVIAPPGADLDDDEDDDEASDSDEAVSTEGIEADSQWGPRRPRCTESEKIPGGGWDDEEELLEQAERALEEAGNVVPPLNLPRTAAKGKKKKKARRKKSKKLMGEIQVVAGLGRARDADILLGVQEFKAAESITAHIGFLPSLRKKGGAA